MSGYTHAATLHNVAYSHLHPLVRYWTNKQHVPDKHLYTTFMYTPTQMYLYTWDFDTRVDDWILPLWSVHSFPLYINIKLLRNFSQPYIIGYGLHKLHMIFHFSSLNIVYFNIFWFFLKGKSGVQEVPMSKYPLSIRIFPSPIYCIYNIISVP